MLDIEQKNALIKKFEEKAILGIDVTGSVLRQYYKDTRENSLLRDISIVKNHLKRLSGFEDDLEQKIEDKQKILEDTIKEFFAMKQSSDIDIKNNVKIGSVVPSIPPTRISVEEVKGGKIVSGIRSNNTYQIKNGRGSIRITLDLVFTNKRSINEELFTLIAELRTSPFTVIENEYIRDAINGKLLTEEVKQENDELTRELAFLTRERENIYTKIGYKLGDLGYSDTELYGKGKIIDFTLSDEKIIENIRRELAVAPKFVPSTIEEPDSYRKALSEIPHLLEELRNVTRTITRRINEKVSRTAKGIEYLSFARIPVVLENIILQNASQEVETIEVQLSFFFYNTSPDAGNFLYRALNGSWVLDPRDSTLWLGYVYRRVNDVDDLNMRKVKDYSNKPISFVYPIHDSKISKPDLRLTDARQYVDDRKKNRTDKRYYRTLTIATKLGNQNTHKENSIYLPNTILDNVQVGFASNIIPQTTLSSRYPTFQYLGGSTGNVIIRLVTTYDELPKFQDIKNNLDKISIDSGSKASRINYLEIKNCYILDLIGLTTFQIDSITTNTASPDRVVVDLQLSSFKPLKRAKLTLIPQLSTSTSRGLLTFILSKLVVWAARYLNISKDLLDEKGRPLDESKKYLQQAFSILFGWKRDDKYTGILTPRFWKAYKIAFPGEIKVDNITSDPKLIWEVISGKSRFDEEEKNISLREIWRSETFVKKAISILFRDDIDKSSFTGNKLPDDLILKDEISILSSIPIMQTKEFASLAVEINREIYKNSQFELEAYPDLNLPSYNELFSDISKAILERSWEFDPPSAPVLTPSSETFNLVTPVEDAVIDGDTIKILYNNKVYRVRLLSINTTEKGTFGAKAAEQFLERLLKEGQVSLEDKNGNSITSLPGPDTDVYGRTLAYVKVGGTLVNELIIKNGWSEYWTGLGISIPYDTQLKSAQNYAETNKKGLYGVLSGNDDTEDLHSVWPAIIPPKLKKTNLFPDYEDLASLEDPLIIRATPVRGGFAKLDPDFYLYGAYLNKSVLSLFDNVISSDMDDLAGGLDKAVIQSDKALRDSLNDGKDLVVEKFRNTGSITKKKLKHRDKAKRNLDNSDPIEDGLDVRKVTNVDQGDLVEGKEIGRFDPEDKNNVKGILRKAIQQKTTLDKRTIKAFPTIQLFLVREENGFLDKFSDWYGYNNIVNCSVTRHKFQPDLCTITISNPVGILENLTWDSDEISLNAASFSRRQSEQEPARARRKQEKEDRILKSTIPDTVLSSTFSGENGLFLTEGTKIVVKMGYSSSTSELETVFTGKVSEIQRGDYITLVAQGFGGELTFPLVSPEEKEESIDLDTSWGWIKRILGFKVTRKHPILTLVNEIFSRSPAENFGDWGIKQIIRHRGEIDTYLEDFEKVTSGLLGATPFIGEFIKALAADPRLENVGGFVTPIGKPKVDIDFLDDKSDWIVKQEMTGISVLRDITLQYPEYMWMILPYDERATLYFGPPNGFYYDSGKYRLLRAKLRRNIKAVGEPIISIFNKNTELDKLFLDAREALTFFFNQVNKVKAIAGSKTLLEKEKDNPSIINFNVITGKDALDLERLASIVTEVFGDYELGMRIVSAIADLILEEDLILKPEITLLGTQPVSSARNASRITLKEFSKFRFENRKSLSVRTAEYLIFKKPINFKNINIAFGASERVIKDTIKGTDFPQRLANDEKNYIRNMILARRLLFIFLQKVKEADLSNKLNLLKASRAKRLSIERTLLEAAKPVVNYHFVDSYKHIIANNIIATRGVMANTIHITRTRGVDNTVIVSVDDDLKEGEHVVTQISAPNAENNEELWRAGFGHLAEAMRPMYRGDLVLRGIPTIKPYDVVWINDAYTKMWGPIEVERVTHNFDFQTGFTTTITPHLYCRATGHASWWETQGAGMLWANVALASITAAGIIAFGSVAAPISALLYISGYLYATKKVGDFVAEDILDLGTGLYGLAVGRGNYGGERTPLAITPLMFNGEPFVAALEGYKKDKFSVWKPLKKRVERIRKGWRRFIRSVESGWDTLGELGE